MERNSEEYLRRKKVLQQKLNVLKQKILNDPFVAEYISINDIVEYSFKWAKNKYSVKNKGILFDFLNPVIALIPASFYLTSKVIELPLINFIIYMDRRQILNQRKPRKFTKSLSYLQYILPPRYREEFEGDLYEIEAKLIKEGCNKWLIRAILLSNAISVMWVVFRIKYREYFSTQKEISHK